MKKIAAAALAIAAMLAVASPSATAQPYGDYRYQDGAYGGGYGGLQLQGLGVNSAKAQLSNAGYRAARSVRFDGRQYDLWSNSRTRDACVGFTSYNGRVTDVRSFSDSECGVVSSGGWGRGIDASDLHGLRVDDAKRGLRDNGYTNTRNVRLNGKQWDLWLDGRGRDCIGFTSYNGIVSAAQSFRGNECDGNGGLGWGYRIDARDLRGLSVDQAKRSLANAGFRGARSINNRGQQWDLWYDSNGRGGRCIGFTSYNGRVTDADNFSPRDCT